MVVIAESKKEDGGRIKMEKKEQGEVKDHL